MPDSIIQQINGGVEQLAPPSALQTKLTKDQGALRDFLSQLFGIKDAVRAYKGEMTEDEAQNFALTAALGVLPMVGELGPAARAAEEVVPEATQSITQMIRAYHGSPYDFDKFSLEKIGTGEGAQAYGYGLYFAQNPAVARSYDPRPEIGSAAAGIGLREKTPGRIYEVNINADPEHFLDWDKPLSEQSPQVREALKSQGITNLTGLKYASQNPEATAALRQAGIPGIRYLDQGSRNVQELPRAAPNGKWEVDWHGPNRRLFDDYEKAKQYADKLKSKGTYNYVVFDDKLVDIIKKYGLAGLIAGSASNFMPKQK